MMKIYQIGGSVRDMLMQCIPHDIDYVVVGSSPQEMLAQGYKQVGKNFPVFINPQNGCEYALARKEVKTGPKHTDFQFVFDASITLSEDMERRDFTCNAIALDTENNQIIDYHNGQEDIKNKILRHINSEHFVEDPLRILRLCRFAAQLDFTPASETLSLVTQMVQQGQLHHLTAERIWQEILKALQTKNFSQFLTVAQNCGALNIILPEITDNLAQILTYLQQPSANNARIKLAITLHKINCSQTIKNICRRLKIPNDFYHFVMLCTQNHAKLHTIRQISPADLVDFVDNFNGKNYQATPDFINFYQAITLSSEQANLANNISLFKTTAQILQNVKASDMPNFSSLPKDNNFQQHFREYKITLLQK